MGRKCYSVQLLDLERTSLDEININIRKHSKNVYIVAHGGLFVNDEVFDGEKYFWNSNDDVKEYFSLYTKNARLFLSDLDVNIPEDNLFGCYISPSVRKRRNNFFSPKYSSLKAFRLHFNFTCRFCNFQSCIFQKMVNRQIKCNYGQIKCNICFSVAFSLSCCI